MSFSGNDSAAKARLIKLSGPLNLHQAEKVSQSFKEIVAQGIERVVIDLQDVPFIDSRGLAALIVGYKLFGRSGQNFRLAALQGQPKLLLELTGLDHIFQVVDSAEAFV